MGKITTTFSDLDIKCKFVLKTKGFQTSKKSFWQNLFFSKKKSSRSINSELIDQFGADRSIDQFDDRSIDQIDADRSINQFDADLSIDRSIDQSNF